MTNEEIEKLKTTLIDLGTTNMMNWSTYWRLEELQQIAKDNLKHPDKLNLETEDVLSMLLLPDIRETIKNDRAKDLAILKAEYGLDLEFWVGFTSEENLGYFIHFCNKEELKEIDAGNLRNDALGLELVEFVREIEKQFQEVLRRTEEKKMKEMKKLLEK